TNPSGESGFPINLPRPVDIIEKMLTTQMNAVTSGEYVVISDFTSFQKEQLDTFTLAMKARITSGLVVRRLFFCFKHDKLIPLDEVKRIAREHRAIACEFPGKYEVRFTMPQKTVAEPPHEGVFTTSERSVRFTVLSPDLHQMEFFSHKQGHEPANFSELWRHAIPAKNDNESQAKFERYLGALTSEWPRGGGRR
ncbi:MAG: hypothetical protein ACREO5_09045, partial [Candidatus Binatia bacterium]